MDLPLHEQLKFDSMRRMVRQANPEQAQEIALLMINYAAANRGVALTLMQSNVEKRF